MKAFFGGALWVNFSQPASAQIPTYVVLRNARIVERGLSRRRDDPWQHHRAGRAFDPRAGQACHRYRRTALAPGFVDVHYPTRGGIFPAPMADNFVRQGVTP